MEFQVPHHGDEDDEELYQDIIYYLTESLDLHVNTDKRFYYLRFKDEGEIYEAEVGKVFEPLDEVVIAIFEGGMMFYVCTQDRGVPGSDQPPMMVEKAGKILRQREFED
jgi:hypothetical protein